MKNTLLLFTLLFSFAIEASPTCGGKLWTLKISIIPVDSYKVLITQHACTKSGEHIDGEFHEYGELFTPQLVDEGYSYKGQIIDSNDNIVEDFVGGGDELSVVDTSDDFPFLVLLSSFYGASNISHTYYIYSTNPVFKRVAEIRNPLNKYQVTKKQGNERIVDGFYQDSEGNFLIDILTTEGTEIGKCNACQEWNVETLKVVEDSLVSLDIRDYDINNYEKLK